MPTEEKQILSQLARAERRLTTAASILSADLPRDPNGRAFDAMTSVVDAMHALMGVARLLAITAERDGRLSLGDLPAPALRRDDYTHGYDAQ